MTTLHFFAPNGDFEYQHDDRRNWIRYPSVQPTYDDPSLFRQGKVVNFHIGYGVIAAYRVEANDGKDVLLQRI